MSRHLIHIGYPKAGSIFLQHWFRRHPQLRYAHGGLGGFHNVYQMAQPSDNTYKYYVTSFEGLSTPNKYAGGINWTFSGAEPPDEVIWKRENQAAICALLKSFYPGSRVIIITRGFKGILISGYSQYVRMGGGLHLDGMCRELAKRLQDDAYHYYDFDSLIRMYAQAFGDENVIVLPYELLRDDSGRFLRLLEEWLGLEHAQLEVGRVNPSLSSAELYWYPVISRRVAAMASKLGNTQFRRIYRRYIDKTMNNKLRLPIKVLERLAPGKKITEAQFPDELLDYFRDKAVGLRKNPLYEPYAADYLWNEDE